MYIERLQVEEGFLDGLDVAFVRGLNVIIGARGTGKTSLIELIRFALDAPAFTESARERGNAQAASVLQGGRVAVSVRTAAGLEVVERDADGPPRYSGATKVTCTVLAQNEIEAIGAQPSGRLHLLDRFRLHREELESEIQTKRLTLQSQSTQLQSLLEEGIELANQVESLQATNRELEEALAEQLSILESVQATEADRERLNQLQLESRRLGAQRGVLSRTSAQIANFRLEMQLLLTEAESVIEEWPEEAGELDLLAGARSAAGSATSLIRDADQRLAEAQNEASRLAERVVRDESALTEATRDIRQRLEALQTGASSVTRRVQHLQERLGQLQALNARLQDRRQQFRNLQDARDSTYADLELARQATFDERQEIAERLSNVLGPTVRVTVSKAARLNAYAVAIANSLRGSGLHYNTLAPMLAKRVSPLELARLSENLDVAELSQITEMPPDRAQAVLAALRAGGVADLVGAEIEDGVGLELLDGAEYKSTESLSIGQRCTVVLPLLLSQRGDPLLIDQPEDHLDNAFVANTLVRSLKRRRSDEQFILATHNANIPVLGEADRVIVLDSDGHRGFVAHCGSLDDPETVGHITSILEGGLEAFERRAAFYARGREHE